MKKTYTLQGLGETVDDVLKTINAFATNTEKRLAYIEKNMATKEDLKNHPTKKDMEGYTTKKDLEVFVTKKDLEAFATKKDLDAFATKNDLIAMKDEIIETVNNKITVEFRKSDRKFGTLVDALDEHKVLPTKVTNRIRAMEPFPQTA